MNFNSTTQLIIKVQTLLCGWLVLTPKYLIYNSPWTNEICCQLRMQQQKQRARALGPFGHLIKIKIAIFTNQNTKWPNRICNHVNGTRKTESERTSERVNNGCHAHRNASSQENFHIVDMTKIYIYIVKTTEQFMTAWDTTVWPTKQTNK